MIEQILMLKLVGSHICIVKSACENPTAGNKIEACVLASGNGPYWDRRWFPVPCQPIVEIGRKTILRACLSIHVVGESDSEDIHERHVTPEHLLEAGSVVHP